MLNKLYDVVAESHGSNAQVEASAFAISDTDEAVDCSNGAACKELVADGQMYALELCSRLCGDVHTACYIGIGTSYRWLK